MKTAQFILMNRTTSRGDCEYLALDEHGETLHAFEASPAVAKRYAQRYRLEAIAPARLLHLWHGSN